MGQAVESVLHDVKAVDGVETVKAIALLGEQQARYDVVDDLREIEPENVRWVHDRKNGELKRIVGQPAERAHRVLTVDDFVSAIRHYKRPATVMVGPTQVVAALDELQEGYHDRIIMELTRTEQFASLENGASKAKRGQREFIDYLRVDLAGCVDADLISKFRQLKTATGDEGTASVQQGKESMSAAVKREVLSGGSDLPEQIDLKVIVYEEVAEVEVHVGDVTSYAPLQVVPAALVIGWEPAPVFRLLPMAGAIASAQRGVLLWLASRIRAQLTGDDVVLCGELRRGS